MSVPYKDRNSAIDHNEAVGFNNTNPSRFSGPCTYFSRILSPFAIIALLTFSSIVIFQAKDVDALTFSGAPINPNFTADGNSLDTGLQLMINFNGPTDSGFYGNSVDIFGVHYGGNMGITNGGWDWTSSTNPDNSTNYHLTSQGSAANINTWNPLDLWIDWAPENGSPVPTGIGSEALNYQNQVNVGYSAFTSTGSMPSPYSIANGPVIVPEPSSVILMLSGFGALITGYVRRRRN